MARSSYVYVVRTQTCGSILGCYTVKKEAVWCAFDYQEGDLSNLELVRFRDGAFLSADSGTVIDWPNEP